VVIKLINMTNRSAFEATAGGTITIDQNATVTFLPNSIVNEAGDYGNSNVAILRLFSSG